MSIFNSQRSSEMYLESVSSWREGMKPAERDRDKGKERSSRAFFFFSCSIPSAGQMHSNLKVP